MDTVETEHKVLDIDVVEVVKALDAIGAKRVYDDVRVITYFDKPDGSLRTAGEGVKLTEEAKLKLEYVRKAPNGQSDTVKLFVSRKEEAVEFLNRMGLVPVTQVRARRISYELDDVDFDIDCFPGILPFMEIDAGGSDAKVHELLDRLGLADHEIIVGTTPEIFSRYGKDYFTEFTVKPL